MHFNVTSKMIYGRYPIYLLVLTKTLNLFTMYTLKKACKHILEVSQV
jgi:hypothetical protein